MEGVYMIYDGSKGGNIGKIGGFDGSRWPNISAQSDSIVVRRVRLEIFYQGKD